MNQVTIPYHLFIPSIISILLITLILRKRKELFRTHSSRHIWISAILFLAVYALTVGNAACSDIYYQRELNRYDLNGDGLFGGEEITAAQKTAMQQLVSDTGRNLSVFTGLIFSAMLAIPVYILLKIRAKIA
ncbi:hypothetical protein [Pontibacter ruber]|uniref:EF-hand domain-containing protein n=1 Tax=Pontibacter ruber TaxID=1343895 RepID=A0ABW5CW58_9BACT|nr:hypothetical protein [Pontibacter ruber]